MDTGWVKRVCNMVRGPRQPIRRTTRQPIWRTASSSWTVNVAVPLVVDTVRGLLGLESVMVTTLSSSSMPLQAQVKGMLWLVWPGWKVTVPLLGVKPAGKAPEAAVKSTDTGKAWCERAQRHAEAGGAHTCTQHIRDGTALALTLPLLACECAGRHLVQTDACAFRPGQG
jgi:hypothetical protein